ncbi:MAG TPA: cytochrome c oxidase assembly protein [Gammaproteobacteria bacterium]|nr:cytochrome c oxidase assembly protein [Gammaproteobacteria bacterium]
MAAHALRLSGARTPAALATAAGVAVLLLAWCGPLPGLARENFVAHMSLHITVVALAAPLLAVGLSAYDDSGRAVVLALPAAVLELAIVWAWHAPALHHLARQQLAWFALEQAGFLASSLAVWWGALATARPPCRHALASGVASLLMTSTHMTLLGVLLALAPRVLYAHGASTTLDAQRIGGLVMLLGGGVSYLAGALSLVFLALRDARRSNR